MTVANNENTLTTQSLHSFLVSMKGSIRQARIHLINHHGRRIKALNEKAKSNEKLKKKSQILSQEIKCVQTHGIDDLSKLVLLCKKSFAAAAKDDSSPSYRAVCRLAEHKAVAEHCARFKEQFGDSINNLPVCIKMLGVSKRYKKIKKRASIGEKGKFIEAERLLFKLLQEVGGSEFYAASDLYEKLKKQKKREKKIRQREGPQTNDNTEEDNTRSKIFEKLDSKLGKWEDVESEHSDDEDDCGNTDEDESAETSIPVSNSQALGTPEPSAHEEIEDKKNNVSNKVKFIHKKPVENIDKKYGKLDNDKPNPTETSDVTKESNQSLSSTNEKKSSKETKNKVPQKQKQVKPSAPNKTVKEPQQKANDKNSKDSAKIIDVDIQNKTPVAPDTYVQTQESSKQKFNLSNKASKSNDEDISKVTTEAKSKPASTLSPIKKPVKKEENLPKNEHIPRKSNTKLIEIRTIDLKKACKLGSSLQLNRGKRLLNSDVPKESKNVSGKLIDSSTKSKAKNNGFFSSIEEDNDSESDIELPKKSSKVQKFDQIITSTEKESKNPNEMPIGGSKKSVFFSGVEEDETESESDDETDSRNDNKKFRNFRQKGVFTNDHEGKPWRGRGGFGRGGRGRGGRSFERGHSTDKTDRKDSSSDSSRGRGEGFRGRENASRGERGVGGGGYRGRGNGTRGGRGGVGGGGFKESNRTTHTGQSKSSKEELHPSWAARRNQNLAITGFQGKKIVFD